MCVRFYLGVKFDWGGGREIRTLVGTRGVCGQSDRRMECSSNFVYLLEDQSICFSIFSPPYIIILEKLHTYSALVLARFRH